ncbi:GNAT family N-acetyltransferase [Sphingobacterium sp. lm-10]|uniref:GNAT family N-acetyltransferase n=1 Tax=Sphingobacterium sp. lm-10 TaxID=2944904 RepID=UPI0020218CBF|nr:GNAT family N-acetyltransferase [Sphingobacterium sp. lm-10]MCL7988268.1 GNAT family N-acetyltransferase [Sphingobacterium sp. lm-10]
MKPRIRPAVASDFAVISKLAHEIWYPTYSPILSKEQIAFMLDQLYSRDGLSQAVAQGKVFYLLCEEEKAIGFIAVRPVPEKAVFRIESLYLNPSTQGKGYGQLLINFAAELAKAQSFHTLELNVNRHNKAHFFYRKVGFVVAYEIDIPYHGYVLDDYVMQKVL